MYIYIFFLKSYKTVLSFFNNGLNHPKVYFPNFVLLHPTAASVLWEVHASFLFFSTLLYYFLLLVFINSHAHQILPHAHFPYHNLEVSDKAGCVKGQQMCGQHSFRSEPACEQLFKAGKDLTSGGHGLGTTRLMFTCLWTVGSRLPSKT